MVENKPNGSGAGEFELMVQFAGFLKYSSIYPSNNVAVKDTCLGLLVAYERLKHVHGSRIVIALEGDRFVVAGVPIVADDTPVIQWVRDAFVRTALGGVKLDSQMQRWSLAKFADRMRENCTYPESTFSQFWRQSYPGITPFELRYSGGNDSAVNDDKVIETLLQNEVVVDRLSNLQSMLAEHLPEGDSAQINLLEPIRKAMPVEALLDPRVACDLVDKILQICESKVLAMVAQKEFTDQEQMEVALAGIGRRYFKAHVKEVVMPAQESLPEGRPEDESTIDDVELMVAEYEALPTYDQRELRIQGDDYTREVLGVYVHSLVSSDSDDHPAVGLIRKVLADDPNQSELLVPYVDRCLNNTGLQVDNRGLWRVVELLQESDPTGILADRQFLTPETVQFTFPRQFVPYIDSLSSGRDSAPNRLDEICRRVGQKRIQAAGDYLLEEAGLVTRERLQRVLSVDSVDMLPLVGVIARISDDWVRDSVARFIRRRNPPLKESAALRVVRPLIWLSPQYLRGLCVLDPSSEHRHWLEQESGRLLRVFLRSTASMDDLMERRVRAVHMLCALPSVENIELLKEIIKERRFGLFSREIRVVRRAARRAHKQMKRQMARQP